MDYLGRIREEEASGNDSSLHKHRKSLKKQKANSIVYGDAIHDPKEGFHPKISVITRPLNMTNTDHKQLIASAEFPKKNMSTDKVSYNHELHKLLSSHHKTVEFEKNNSIGQRASNSKASKFFLNNSLKGFQFKHPGRSHIVDSVSKRSPSFSNSQLPTELPSNKVGSISNSSRPLFSAHKPSLSGKEKGLQVKNFHQKVFEDFKSFSHFKSSMQHKSKMIANMKYPYYFENVNTANYEGETTNRTNYFDEGIFEKARVKPLTRWKEEMRKKVEARRHVSKSPLQNSEFSG